MVKKLWGGRFQKAINADAESFTSSIDVDKDLYNFDIPKYSSLMYKNHI